jgi:hypothetical protein
MNDDVWGGILRRSILMTMMRRRMLMTWRKGSNDKGQKALLTLTSKRT